MVPRREIRYFLHGGVYSVPACGDDDVYTRRKEACGRRRNTGGRTSCNTFTYDTDRSDLNVNRFAFS